MILLNELETEWRGGLDELFSCEVKYSRMENHNQTICCPII